MKRVLALVVALSFFTGFAFANGGQEAKSGEVVIGALIRNTNEPFLADYAENLKMLSKKAGVTLRLQDSRGDITMQHDQLNTLLSQGVKYFVIIANTTEATKDMARAIKAKGGGAVFSNIQPSVEALETGKKFFLVSSHESVAGQIQADILVDYFNAHPEKMKNGDPNAIDAICIYGQLGHPAQIYRTISFIDGITNAGFSINVVAEDTANWEFDEAQQKMDTWLTALDNKFDAVIANNDEMALGAVESLLTHKYSDDPNDPSVDKDGDGIVLSVPVIGVDATPVAVQSMAEKKLYATVLQDAKGQAATAFELAYLLATEGSAIGKKAGGIVPLDAPIDEAPANVASVVNQCYFVPFKAVTMDNYTDFKE